MADVWSKLASKLYAGEADEVAELVQQALDQGIEPSKVLQGGLIAGMDQVGKYIIGTVKGDLHDIGKNLVKMMVEGAGFEVVDLGTDVSPEKFLAAVKEHQPS
jgi:5-methyltetrahydrofolate--homocysteine methyltransferase